MDSFSRCRTTGHVEAQVSIHAALHGRRASWVTVSAQQLVLMSAEGTTAIGAWSRSPKLCITSCPCPSPAVHQLLLVVCLHRHVCASVAVVMEMCKSAPSRIVLQTAVQGGMALRHLFKMTLVERVLLLVPHIYRARLQDQCG